MNTWRWLWSSCQRLNTTNAFPNKFSLCFIVLVCPLTKTTGLMYLWMWYQNVQLPYYSFSVTSPYHSWFSSYHQTQKCPIPSSVHTYRSSKARSHTQPAGRSRPLSPVVWFPRSCTCLGWYSPSTERSWSVAGGTSLQHCPLPRTWSQANARCRYGLFVCGLVMWDLVLWSLVYRVILHTCGRPPMREVCRSIHTWCYHENEVVSN